MEYIYVCMYVCNIGLKDKKAICQSGFKTTEFVTMYIRVVGWRTANTYLDSLNFCSLSESSCNFLFLSSLCHVRLFAQSLRNEPECINREVFIRMWVRS